MSKNMVTREQGLALLNPKKPKNKYRSSRVVVDDITFDSKKEACRYSELCLLKKNGMIKDFKRQVPYPILINNIKVCSYVADFVVTDNDGTVKVIDTKGFKTPVYLLKKRMIKAYYDIEIIEQ